MGWDTLPRDQSSQPPIGTLLLGRGSGRGRDRDGDGDPVCDIRLHSYTFLHHTGVIDDKILAVTVLGTAFHEKNATLGISQ
jgi:hypothetical protein